MECFKTKTGLVLGEFTVRPPGGFLMEAIEQSYGFNPWQTLVDIRLEQASLIKNKPQQYTAAWLYHPGKGHVKKITGLKELSQLASFQFAHIKAKPGDMIKEREGTGQHTAKLFFSHQNYEQLTKDIEAARDIFEIKMI